MTSVIFGFTRVHSRVEGKPGSWGLRTPVGRGRQRPASPWGETEALKRLSVAGYELKLTLAVPQPTCWIQTFWIPSMSGARSWSATITFTFLKEASFPSPAR